MPKTIPADSVGLVTPLTEHFDEPIDLVCGQTLPRFDLIYETYGTLNAKRDNALLFCHALSGDHHAAGYHSMEDRKPGWWAVIEETTEEFPPFVRARCHYSPS